MNQQQQQQIEETMAVISAMCRQEASYATCDYLSQHALNEQSLDVDMESRSLMVEWCYRVVSFTQMNNETVAIAMNILDRFMASSAAGPILADRRSYQLAAMTALYTAVKIFEPEALSPEIVAQISHNTYTTDEIESMEAHILSGVSWRVNPPTALAFVRQYMELISEDQLDKMSREMVYELAKLQTEAAVRDYDFLQVQASTIAYCALANAFGALSAPISLGPKTIATLESAVKGVSQELVCGAQQVLYQALVNQGCSLPAAATMDDCDNTAAKQQQEASQVREQSPSTSPRSVSVQ